MVKGKLIVIEGVDGVGKNTQAKFMTTLLSEIVPVRFFSFPQYHTETGLEISKYLNGKASDLTRMQIAELYANDRLAVRDEINECLDKGIFVICDRYVMSNIAFQSSWYLSRDGAGEEQVKLAQKIINDIDELEYQQNQMPVPDLTLSLILPVDVTMVRVTGKDRREYTDAIQDIHEVDVKLQTHAADFFSKMANMGFSETIKVINCWNFVKKEQYSKQEIHEKIWFPNVVNLIKSVRGDR
jgi:dTMP kinase